MNDPAFCIDSAWDLYVRAVEQKSGHSIDDPRVIDALYTAYLGDVSADDAAEGVGGLQHISGVVERVLRQIGAAREGGRAHD